MNKINVSGVMALLSLLCFVALSPSCMNEEYDMSKKELNLEVTAFQDGLVVPVGRTGQIKMKDLLKNVEADIIGVGPNGAYSISFNDSFDLTEQLSELKDMVSIPDVDFSQKLDFTLGDVNVSDIRMEAQKYSFEYSLPTSFDVPDIKIPSVEETFETNAGLYEYVPDDSALGLSLAPIEYSQQFMDFSGMGTLISMLGDDAITLEDDMFSRYYEPKVEFDVPVQTFPIEISLPTGINSVSDIIMHENAGIRISLELGESFIHTGRIIPDITLDLSSIFILEDDDNGIIHIGEECALSAGNNYKVQSAPFGISSLAVSPEDWTRLNEDSPLKLDKDFEVSVDGSISMENLTTTKALLEASKSMEVSLKVEFIDMQIADLLLGLDPLTFSDDKDTKLLVDNIELPKEISGIENVTFTPESRIDITINSLHMEMMKTLDAEITALEITFPDELQVEGADSNNKICYSNLDLTKEIKETIKLKGVTLPAPVDGKIGFSSEIHVHSVFTAAGSVHCSELPKTYSDDVRIEVAVKSHAEVADYQVGVAGYEQDIELEGKEIKFEIPEELASMKEIIVYPEGGASIGIDFNIPELGLDLLPSSGGITVSFPQMLKFSDLNPAYNYNKETNSIRLTESFASYGKILLPVEKLVLTPVQDSEDNKYYAGGMVGFDGGVAVAPGLLDKAQIESLTDPNSPKNISVVAEISEFVPSKFDIDTFETSLKEEVEFTLMDADDLPEELVSLGKIELNETYINLSLDASSLPDLGTAKLSVDVDIDLPDFIKVNGADQTGFMNISGTLKDGKIGFDPIMVECIDLTGVDLATGVSGKIVVDGSIKLEDASLDVDQWLNKDLEAEFTAKISNIDIAKLTGKVKYDVEPIVETVDLSEFTGMMDDFGAEATLDFNHASLAIEVLTNLNIPVGADVTLIPYYDGNADESRTIKAKLVLNPAESVAQEAATRYWLSDKGDRCPEGHSFLQADIVGLLKNIPEKLELRLEAGTDSESECVLEPSADYTLKANYLFELPLEFGEEFEIEYRDTIKGLDPIIGEVLMTGNKVALKGELTNALPIGLDLAFNFLDSNDEVVPAAEGCGVQKISPCRLDGSASTTELNVLVGLDGKHATTDIAAVEIVLNANSGGVVGVPVTEDAYLQAKLRVALPEGVTIDLKEFLENNENEEDYE